MGRRKQYGKKKNRKKKKVEVVVDLISSSDEEDGTGVVDIISKEMAEKAVTMVGDGRPPNEGGAGGVGMVGIPPTALSNYPSLNSQLTVSSNPSGLASASSAPTGNNDVIKTFRPDCVAGRLPTLPADFSSSDDPSSSSPSSTGDVGGTIECVICAKTVPDDEYHVELRLHTNAMHFSTYVPYKMSCCGTMFGDAVLIQATKWCCDDWNRNNVVLPAAEERNEIIERCIDMFTNHSIKKKEGTLADVIDRVERIVKENPIEDLPPVEVADESVDELLQQIAKLKAGQQNVLQQERDIQLALRHADSVGAQTTMTSAVDTMGDKEQRMTFVGSMDAERQQPSSTLTPK